jgi:GT2 family glycosyltransferase
MDTATSRNAPCHCGSGKRYKHCHGVASHGNDASPTLVQALAEQRAGRLASAESLYRRVLSEDPASPDALHMLAVVRLALGDAHDALELLLRALDATQWRVDAMRTNLGLVLAALAGPRARPVRRRAAGGTSPRAGAPLVSVVMPSFNHGRFVERALRSVLAQDYRNLELVVVDDGSTDDSVPKIARMLRDMPFPARLLERANRGAHVALNEGIGQSQGVYLQFLNSDDMLAPQRISRMVDAVTREDAAWGFSAIAVIDGDDQRVEARPGSRASGLLQSSSEVEGAESVGHALLASNVAVSSGNIFVARALANAIGGFGDYRYNHDWDFCLRALERSEPVFVAEALYLYRLHGANTITESAQRAREEAHAPVAAYLARATSPQAFANPLAPSLAASRDAFLSIVLARGMAALLPVDVLRRAAREAATA